MPGILVYSDNNKLAAELLTAARHIDQAINSGVGVITINKEDQSAEMEQYGANVYQINNSETLIADTAAIADLLQQASAKLAGKVILLSSDRRGKELAGRLAQKLESGCLNDVSGLQVDDGKIYCTRNSLGGAVVTTQSIMSEHMVIALASRAFAMATASAGGSVQELAVEPPEKTVKLLDTKSKAGNEVDISEAEVLVIVGQGVEQEAIVNAESIASKLGGEVACSKPVATDKKWLPEDRIIGLSGKKCKPQLAVILGISGQVQFTVGIRDAVKIIAINNDENAYILQMADYAMVGDANMILSELEQKLG